MRFRTTCLALLASLAACLGMASIAAAASSPTATIGKATDIGDTSAKLSATIDPNGSKTTYYFSYGPTKVPTSNSPAASAGSGTKDVAGSATIKNLVPGTTYYYTLAATNASGTSTTKQASFKTGGIAPAQATTGGANVDSATTAQMTGTVNTAGVYTEYYFEYGTTPAYGSLTMPQALTGTTGSQTVSYELTGLTPGQTYYYALVAINGPSKTNTSTGAQDSFVTWPSPVPSAEVVGSTKPLRVTRGPVVLTTSGRIGDRDASIPAADVCTGAATVSIYNGHHLVSRTNMAIASNCFFNTKTLIKNVRYSSQKPVKLTVYTRFDGNHYVKTTYLRTETITLG